MSLAHQGQSKPQPSVGYRSSSSSTGLEHAVDSLTINTSQYPHQQQQYYPQHSYQKGPPPQQQQQQQYQPQYQHQPQQQQYQQPYQPANQYQQPHPQKVLTTITATISSNSSEQTKSIGFHDPVLTPVRPRPSPSPSPAPQPQTSGPVPHASIDAASSSSTAQQKKAKDLTPEQQREAEVDANLQRGIELHENNQLEEATMCFKLAAQSNNPVGQLMYGLSLRHGWGCKPNPKDALVYLQLAAEYAMGEIKELNPSTGNLQFAVSNHAQKHPPSMSSSPPSSSSQKLPRALQRMGTMDRKSAMLTARKELVMALYELGMSFLKGWGVTRDKVVAFSYFKLAADLGDADSQNETAQCFLDGIGTEKNSFEAARYYRMAAAQGAAQMGNSWIFKPKYDQYCANAASQAEAESAARKTRPAGGAMQDKPLKSPVSPTSLFGTSPPSTSNRHSLSSALHRILPSRSSQEPPPPPVPTMNGAAAPGRGLMQHSPAGELITSSQLELKVKQAEALTRTTVIPELMEEPQGKKKHRWSLWPQGSRHRSSSTD
ncbi:hypothetical protein BGZ92_003331 [Podila epicladia]|nr:hypothetical protein BGZ92_003331 [Podila epicladia]